MATPTVQHTPFTPLTVPLRPASVAITYFAFCDIGEQAGSVAEERLKHLASAASSSIIAAYDVATSIIHTRTSSAATAGPSPRNLLSVYCEEMYTKRIAPFARTQRFGQMYQLEDLTLLGLSDAARTPLLPNSEVVLCHPVVSVTNLGVASVHFWVQLPRQWQIQELVPFSDPSKLLVTTVDYSICFGTETWILRRNSIPLLEVMAFVAGQLLCELGALSIDDSLRRSTTSWLKELEARRGDILDGHHLRPLPHVETFSVFHIDYSEGQPEVTSDGLEEIRAANAPAIRALVTRDSNWKFKKPDIVKSKLDESSCSTRDSLLWYVASQGAVKLYSHSLETDKTVSMVLAAFEIELLLGMRYFLEKINYSLNAVQFAKTSPRLLAKIHRQNVERLDSFFSLANCTKDTTADRLERLGRSFRIAQLSNTTAEKIRALSELVAANNAEKQQRNADKQQQNQMLLAVLFGVFGLGQLLASFFFWYYTTPSPVYLWWQDTGPQVPAFYSRMVLVIGGSVLVAMLLFGLALYLFVRNRRQMADEE